MEPSMIVFTCHVCKTTLKIEDAHAGQMVRCPTCMAVVQAPAAAAAPMASVVAVASAPGPAAQPQQPIAQSRPRPAGATPWVNRPGGRRYGFNCPYCSSRLEATEALAAQEGQCPTCGNQITIPILDRYNRLIDPHTRQIIKQDPHPVHAYAAAGDRAPRIIRDDNGNQLIVCPRCSAHSAITSNNCKSCGMPFTMEGTTFDGSSSTDGFCITALVVGILGLLTFLLMAIVPLAAIAFGAIGIYRTSGENTSRGGRGLAIAGICLGVVGLIFFAMR
ncbi:MAG TPA: DUF4190 domain-containing protein [Tepidisphaeraceae bacterium]|nr:DUF4190 domain-containing protein [Tepidisphaeraceae bacterium]